MGEENIGNIGWTTLNNRHEIPKAIHRVFGKIVVRIQEGDAIGLYWEWRVASSATQLNAMIQRMIAWSC